MHIYSRPNGAMEAYAKFMQSLETDALSGFGVTSQLLNCYSSAESSVGLRKGRDFSLLPTEPELLA